MHVYFITRGMKHYVDRFIELLQGLWLPFKWRNGMISGSKIQDGSVQIQVRPIQLWEVVVPAESRDVLFATLFGKEKGKTQHGIHEKIIWMIRKALGIKPIGEYKSDLAFPVIAAHEHFEIAGIGEKEDYWVDKDGKKMDHKEEGAFEGL